MRRCFWFLLMLAVAFAAEPRGIPLAMAADLTGTEAPARNLGEGAEEQPPKQMDNERNRRDEGRFRKGIGADFWGGPYWGYGPRWGHPCESCRSTCEADRDSPRCERCRVRCGW